MNKTSLNFSLSITSSSLIFLFLNLLYCGLFSRFYHFPFFLHDYTLQSPSRHCHSKSLHYISPTPSHSSLSFHLTLNMYLSFLQTQLINTSSRLTVRYKVSAPYKITIQMSKVIIYIMLL